MAVQKNLLIAYINWHFNESAIKLVRIWRNCTILPLFYFSVPFNIKTFFAPWKRVAISSKKPGFHLDDFISVLSFNVISRIIGALVRFLLITIGIFLSVIICLTGFVIVVGWFLLFFVSLPFYFTRSPSDLTRTKNLIEKYENISKLTFFLFQEPEGKFVIQRLNLNYNMLIDTIKTGFSQPGADKSLVLKTAPQEQIGMTHLFQVVSEQNPLLKQFLNQQNLTPDDVFQTMLWFERKKIRQSLPLILDYPRITRLAGIGADLFYGYTSQFNKYAQDLTKFSQTYPLLLGREKEILKIEQILSATEHNNVLLIGEPGISRHALVQTLAQRIRIGICQPQLSHKRILSLNMHAVTASKTTTGEIKGLFSTIIDEARAAGNIIILIDEIDRYISYLDNRIDLTDVFEKLARSDIPIIGITTSENYYRYIEHNSTFTNLFKNIEIESPSLQTVIEEMQLAIIPVLELKHRVLVTYTALKRVIESSERYISESPFPTKAIELLDQVCIYALTIKKNKIIIPEYVDEFLSEKLHTSLGTVGSSEKEKLTKLEELLHKTVVNQETAIHAISSALRRARLDIVSQNRPIGSFLFLGPTGVGKTETAKALARVYFSQNAVLRFDMSEYQLQEGFTRLIGSYTNSLPGELTAKLANQPFSLLLFDEIEKAHKDIFNLLLTILDEGYITDAFGKKVNAKNTIIIATSNAAAEFIRESIIKGVSSDELKTETLEHIQETGIFSPEFLNRFDAVVVFTPLSKTHVQQVARLMLEDLNLRLKPKEISLAVTDELIAKLAEKGYDPQFGARTMRRIINETVEDQIAQKLLKENIKGKQITIDI